MMIPARCQVTKMSAPGDYIGRLENFKAPSRVFAYPGAMVPLSAEKLNVYSTFHFRSLPARFRLDSKHGTITDIQPYMVTRHR